MANLVLAAPGLWPQSLTACSTASRKELLKDLLLSAISPRGEHLAPNWERVLTDISGIRNTARSAAIFWLGETQTSATSWICRADPLHLRTAGGGLLALPLHPDALSLEEARELVRALNRHLQTSGYHLSAQTATHWYLQGEKALALPQTTPTDRLDGRFIEPDIFRQPDFTVAQQLRTELEMCLFEQPLNQQRELLDKPSINSLWLWGGSTASKPAPAPKRFCIYADDPLIKGCARAGQQAIQALPQKLDKTVTSRLAVASNQLLFLDSPFQNVTNPVQWQQQMRTLDRDWLKPAWQALRNGQLSGLTIIDPDRLRIHWTPRQTRRWRYFGLFGLQKKQHAE